MPDASRRDRRRLAAVTAIVLTLVGVGLLSYAVVAQQPGPPSAQRASALTPTPHPEAGGGHGHHGATETKTSAAVRGRQGAQYRRPTGPILEASAPVRIRIPALDLSTEIMRLGLQDDGTMQVPQSAGRAGWFDGSPTPGALGPSVIVGHVTWDKKPDVFFSLGKLKPGQQVHVVRKDGSTAVFRVTKVEQYAKKDFPTKDVYGNVDRAALRLITCGGVFDGASGHYLDNVIAFAELHSSSST